MLFIMGFRVARRGRVRLVAFGRDRCGSRFDEPCRVGRLRPSRYDLPLFLFIAGVRHPTRSPSSVREECPKGRIYAKIVRRGLTLVVLGMVYNGLFKTDFENLRIASVLGRIGLAWSIAAVLYLNFGVKTRAAIAVAVLAGYGALSALVAAPGRRRRRAADLRGESGRLYRPAVPARKRLIYGVVRSRRGCYQHGARRGDSHAGHVYGRIRKARRYSGRPQDAWMAAAAAALLAAGAGLQRCCP